MNFLFVFTLTSLSLGVVVSASAEGQKVNAEVGGNVTLPCKAENYVPFEVVEWSRPEKNSEHVLVVRNKQVHPKILEQSYKGRVDLADMEKGDVSLKLTNVRAEDGGTYECYVVRGANRKKRAIQPISIVNLVVAPPGRGHIGLVAGLMICALVILTTLTAVLILKKRKSFRSLSPHDEAENPQNVDMSRTFLSHIFSHDSNPAIRKPTRTFHPDAGPKPGQMERVV